MKIEQNSIHRISTLVGKVISGLLLLALLFGPGPSSPIATVEAADPLPPHPPHTFYGAARLDGALAADGAVVEAQVSHSITQTFTISGTVFSQDGQTGLYQLVLPADDPETALYDGGRNGDSVTFRVANTQAAQTAIFAWGETSQLDLTVLSVNTPTATATSTATSLPTATATATSTATTLPTATATATSTATTPPTATATATSTATTPPKATVTATSTATTPTTATVTATSTATTPPTATATATSTATTPPTATATATSTATTPPKATVTATSTATTPTTATVTATSTATTPPTATATATSTATTPPKATATATSTATTPPTATATTTNTPTATPTPTNTPDVSRRDCSQDDLVAAIGVGGSGTVTLDGTCRYLLTRVDFNGSSSGPSGIRISNAARIEGNGAIIERGSTAPQMRLLLLNSPDLVIRDLTFRGGDSPQRGGALSVYAGPIVLENVRIEDSVADWGGGLYSQATTTLRNSTVSGNSAASQGGGIYVIGSIILESSTFTGNQAGDSGGGIYHYGQTLTVSNSVFANNESIQLNSGAHIHNTLQGSSLNFTHSTFTDDALNANPALYVWGEADLKNSILANHQIGLITAGGPDYPVVEDYNLFAGIEQATVIYNSGNIIRGIHSIVALNPRFVDPSADNFRLESSSPAIDSGTAGGSSTDADGQPRPVGDAPDMGAYEFQGQSTVALQIEKESLPWIVAGRASQYGLIVFNVGKTAAQDLEIVEQLPDGAAYVADSASDGGSFAGGSLTWIIGDLAPGESKRVIYQATASQTLISDNYRVRSRVDSNILEQGQSLTTPLNTQIIAALDFQPDPDGFYFRNYTDSPQSDLTVEDMVFIYGADKVCKSQNPCVLTAAAEAWRQKWLAIAEGGHCAGMAIGSLDIFANTAVVPGDFQAGADVTFDLTKENARRYIALYMSTQTIYPVDRRALLNQGLDWRPAKGPTAVLNALLANFNDADAPDRHRLSYQPSPLTGEEGGHAVVPYAIEQLSSNEYLIYIYDNNAPNDYTRAIRIDTEVDSWRYVETGNPTKDTEYYGVAADKNFAIVSWRWASSFPKRCGFCSGTTSTVSTSARTTEQDVPWIEGEFIEFQLDGEGYLLVVRNDGKRVGYDVAADEWVNEIDGALEVEVSTGMGLSHPPTIQIPHVLTATYSLQVSNRETAFGNLTATGNVNIFGPEFAVRLTGLQINSPELTPVEFGNERLDEGGRQTAVEMQDQVEITFAPGENRVVYQASDADGDTPSLSLAVNNPNGADYSFRVDGVSLNPENSVALAFDPSTGTVSVENNDSKINTYAVEVVRTNSDGSKDNYQATLNDGEGVGVSLHVGSDWDGKTPPKTESIQEGTLLNAFSKTFLPILSWSELPKSGPDLVVDAIWPSASGVDVVIKNQGDTPVVDEFWVDLYLDPTTTPTAVNQLWQNLGEQGAVWGVTSDMLPLQAGGTLALSLSDPHLSLTYSNIGGPLPAGARLFAQVDSWNGETSYGAVLEGHEQRGGAYNNIIGPVTLAREVFVSSIGEAQAATPGHGGRLPVRPGLPSRSLWLPAIDR